MTSNRTERQGDAIRNHAGFIWSVADLLRGDYKQSEYGKVSLPLTVIRRLDCVLGGVAVSLFRYNEPSWSKVGPLQ